MCACLCVATRWVRYSATLAPLSRDIAFPAVVPRASSAASERSGSAVLRVFNEHCRSMHAGTVQSLTFIADNMGHLVEDLVSKHPQVMAVPGGVIHSRGGAATVAYHTQARAGSQALSPASATSAVEGQVIV